MNQELETIAANLAHQIENTDADQLQALCRDIVSQFLTLRTCCEEALTGDWEVNDEGFQDMKKGIDDLFCQWEPEGLQLVPKIEERIKFLVSVGQHSDAEMQRNILKALKEGMTLQDLDRAMDLHLSIKGGGGNEETRFIKNLITANV